MAKVVRIYYDMEQTKLNEEYYEIDEKKEGIYKRYYGNGNLMKICNYIDDKRNGEFKSYHMNGQLNFINNKVIKKSKLLSNNKNNFVIFIIP
jgi:antitoxin component YwqK of YwqJK toxin-antitoxin module